MILWGKRLVDLFNDRDIFREYIEPGRQFITMFLELKHHGVVGMRWGIRRYQPYADGTFRSNYKSHYNESFKKKLPVYYRTGNMSSDEYVRATELWNSVAELDLPQSEREYVYEELDNNLTAEEKESAIVSRPIDNYQYTAINKGHNQYKIINKELIDKPLTNDIIDEVLTEMFGSDWRDWLDED